MRYVSNTKEPDGKRYVNFTDDNNNFIAAEIKKYYENSKDPLYGVHRSTGRKYAFGEGLYDKNPSDIKEIKPNKLRGFFSGVADDMTFGFNDEILALAGKGKYKDNLERRRAIKKARRQNNPGYFLAGNLSGLVTPFLPVAKLGLLATKGVKKGSDLVTKKLLSGTIGGFNLAKPVRQNILLKQTERAFPFSKTSISGIKTHGNLHNVKALPDNTLRKEARFFGFNPTKNRYYPTEKQVIEATAKLSNNRPSFLKNVGVGVGFGALHGFGSGEGWNDKFESAGIGAGLGGATGGLFLNRFKPKYSKNRSYDKRDRADVNIKNLLNLDQTVENQVARRLFKDDINQVGKLGSGLDNNYLKTRKIAKDIKDKEAYIDDIFDPNKIKENKPFIKELYNKLDNQAKDNFTLEERRDIFDFLRNPKSNELQFLRAKNIISPKLKQDETFLDYHEGISNPIKDDINYKELGNKEFLKKLIENDYFINNKGRFEKAEKIGDTLSDTLSRSGDDDLASNTGRKIKANILKDVDDKTTRHIEDQSTFVRSRIVNETWHGFMRGLGIDPPDSRKLYTYLKERGDSIDELYNMIKMAENTPNKATARTFLNAYLIDKNKVQVPQKFYEQYEQE